MRVLRDLNCSSNKLTSLTLTSLPNLSSLNCSSNDLTSLNITGLDSLRDLNCSNNNISDVKGLEEWSKKTGNTATILPQKVATNSENNGNNGNSGSNGGNSSSGNNGGVGDANSNNVTVASKDGKWIHSSKGWWYRYTDGTYAVGLTKIKSTTYYFDAKGWMKTGWRNIGPNADWYYFKSSGAMATGWQKIKGKWYLSLIHIFCTPPPKGPIPGGAIVSMRVPTTQGGASTTFW